MPSSVIEDRVFSLVKDAAQADNRGRLTLGSMANSKSYRVLTNASGQILLDPLVQIPEWELKILQDSAKHASLSRGIEEAKEGKATSLGSFAKYASKPVKD